MAINQVGGGGCIISPAAAEAEMQRLSSSSRRSREPSKRDSSRCRTATGGFSKQTPSWQGTQPALTRPLYINRAVPATTHVFTWPRLRRSHQMFISFVPAPSFLKVVPNPDVFTTASVENRAAAKRGKSQRAAVTSQCLRGALRCAAAVISCTAWIY